MKRRVCGVDNDANSTKADGNVQNDKVGPLRNPPAGVDVFGVGEG